MDEVAMEGQGDQLQDARMVGCDLRENWPHRPPCCWPGFVMGGEASGCNLQTDQRKGTGHAPRRTGIPERQDCSPDSLRGRPAGYSSATTGLG